MRFLRPDMAVWLSALIPVVLASTLRYMYKRRFARDRPPSRLRRFGGTGRGPAARLSRRSSPWKDVAVAAFGLIALAALAIALMRPQFRVEERTPTFARRDLIVVLDRSVSMRARDIRPSRFDRAIDEIQQFLRRKPDSIDRVALIGFASTSIVLSYPTDDLGSLFFYLDWMRDDPTTFFGTDLTVALTNAMSVVAREPQRIPPLVVVISDGDDQGPPLDPIATRLSRSGMRVHAIGIGSDQSVPMPLAAASDQREDYLRDDSGRVLLTRFNERHLQELATLTGGRYFRSVTGMELRDALEKTVELERPQVGWETSVSYRDLYVMALAAAALAAFGLVMLL